jgi:hypothetical protein
VRIVDLGNGSGGVHQLCHIRRWLAGTAVYNPKDLLSANTLHKNDVRIGGGKLANSLLVIEGSLTN